MEDRTKGFTPPPVSGYEIQSHIGSGGTASVWLARQVSLNRFVAIKFLRPEVAKSPEYVKQFNTEAKAAAQIQHPGIARVFDTGESGGIPYFVMEYIHGISLATWIDQNRRMPYMQALQIAAIVAEILNGIWEETGLIHCDIKPGNILMEESGIIKVADFGLARKAGAVDLEAYIEGTPSYIAPEQISGETTDCRTDIYAMGLTLFHLITGRYPFDGREVRDVLDAQQLDYLADPCDLIPDLPISVGWLLAKMTAKNPDRRPKNWTEVMQDIVHIQNGQSPQPPYPGEDESTILLRPQHRPSVRPTAPSAPPGKKKSIQITASQASQLKVIPKKKNGKGCLVRLCLLGILLGGGVVAGWYFKDAVLGYVREFLNDAPKGDQGPRLPVAPVTGEGSEEKNMRTVDAPASERTPSVVAFVETGTDVPGAWNHPEFIQAATLFNQVLTRYQAYLQMASQSAVNPPPSNILDEVRKSAALFENIRRQAPADVPVTRYANQCYQLIHDLLRTQVTQEDLRLQHGMAPKSHHPDQTPWPTPAVTDVEDPFSAPRYMQLGYAWDARPAPVQQIDSTELTALLTPVVRASPSTKAVAGQPIHGGLRWLLPLIEAESVLQATETPARTPVSGSSFPLGGVFMQTYPAGRYGQKLYSTLRLITDSEDQLIAVQLVESNPQIPLQGNPEIFSAQTIDFITGETLPDSDSETKRASHALKTAPNLIRIDTEVADFRMEPPMLVYRTRLLLPQGLAQNVLYHLTGEAE